jgi:hypothetical protein
MCILIMSQTLKNENVSELYNPKKLFGLRARDYEYIPFTRAEKMKSFRAKKRKYIRMEKMEFRMLDCDSETLIVSDIA